MIVAVVMAPIQIWVRGRRWWYLFPPGSNPEGVTPAMMIGYMANNVLPLRAGEVVRVYVVARRWSKSPEAARSHPFWTTLATLIVERVLDSLIVVLILAVLVLVVPVPRFLEVAALIVLAIDLSGVTMLIALVAAPQLCARLITRVLGRWPGLRRRALTAFETFVHGLDGIRTPSHAVPLIGWTILVWLAPAFAAWTVLMALDLHLPLAAPWAVLAFVGLGISIPSAPGYIGTFHFFAKTALGLFGVSDAAGVGYALLFHASQILPVTLIGWLYLLRENMSLGDAARARASAEPGTAG